MRTALGFRAHSGWAAMAAAGGTMEAPRVIERRRIVIADAALPGSKQPYHFAAELPSAEAEAHVRWAVESARTLAAHAINAMVLDLRALGHEVTVCGILRGSAKLLPGLASILASHALIHTAEGVMFREVLASAAASCGLAVCWTPEKDIQSRPMKHIDSLGKQIGPPWTQDQKYATAAALMALAECADTPAGR